jgi:hypothetical protein
MGGIGARLVQEFNPGGGFSGWVEPCVIRAVENGFAAQA